jgi:predicted RNA binding protein YcfA (HicA-like mRNA interferase family)
VHFGDFCRLVESVGFARARVHGSHRIYHHDRLSLVLSLQDAGGCAKPYQIRQFLRTMERYALDLREGR